MEDISRARKRWRPENIKNRLKNAPPIKGPSLSPLRRKGKDEEGDDD
jgi:hypothetical protein